MRRLSLSALLLALILASALPGTARAIEAGTSLLALEITEGDGDFVAPDGPYLPAYQHGELGIQAQYWYLTSPTLALAVSAGVARTREQNSAAGQVNRYYQQRSMSARVGVDRVVDLGRNALLYFGPGIEYWKGHANFIGIYAPSSTVTAPEVTRWSVSGRLGGMMVLSAKFGLTGHIGYRMSTASASNDTAETLWYSNGTEGSAGVVVAF